MNKKFAIIGAAAVVIIVGVVVGIVIGVNSNKAPEPEEAPLVVDDTHFSINGQEFELDTKKEFEGLKYKISKEFRELKFDVYTHYVQYDYLLEDGNLLYYRVFHYTDKDADAAAQDLGLENYAFTDGKTDNVEYKYYAEPRNDGTMHFYFITKDTDTYVIHLASKYDIKEFEEKALKTIGF